jgi:hypothetical protein
LIAQDDDGFDGSPCSNMLLDEENAKVKAQA